MTRSLLDNVSPKTTRRLAAAEGYLELNMPAEALDELEPLSDRDLGSLSVSYNFLKGEALRMLGEVQEASTHLEQAAREMPAPLRHLAWKSLQECYEQLGNHALANMAAMIASAPEDVQEVASKLAGSVTEVLYLLGRDETEATQETEEAVDALLDDEVFDSLIDEVIEAQLNALEDLALFEDEDE